MNPSALITHLTNDLQAAIGRRKLNISSRELAACTDPFLRRLAKVFDETAHARFSRDEQLWMDNIERLRGELFNSDDILTITDFGAGEGGKGTPTEGRIIRRTVGDVCRSSSGRPLWCRLFFKLVREFRPDVCFELGTSLGISAAYFAAAGQLNQQGNVVTLEGAEALVVQAKKNLANLSLSNVNFVTGRFQDTLSGALQQYAPIQIAFLDGHHDRNATLAYLDQIVPFLADNAVVILDDVKWSKGMREAWSIIQEQPRFKTTVDLFEIALCVFDRSGTKECGRSGQ